MDSAKHVLLAATGSVAAVRTPAIQQGLLASGHSVKVVATEAAKEFFKQEIPDLIDEGLHWEAWREQGEVLHIELRKWADILVIAPLDANTLAKMACGLCDNILVKHKQTCIVRAWDLEKPIVIAPAMNTNMWNNPFTEKHFRKIQKIYNVTMAHPIEKLLACNDQGIGGIADTESIVSICDGLLSPK